jgi:hypothetical protein
MECFRRAMLPGIPDSAAIRWHGKAVDPSPMSTGMVRTLKECQAATRTPQPGSWPAMPRSRPRPPQQAAATLPKPAGRQPPQIQRGPQRGPIENPSGSLTSNQSPPRNDNPGRISTPDPVTSLLTHRTPLGR